MARAGIEADVNAVVAVDHGQAIKSTHGQPREGRSGSGPRRREQGADAPKFEQEDPG
jgi:hypothetical protein